MTLLSNFASALLVALALLLNLAWKSDHGFLACADASPVTQRPYGWPSTYEPTLASKPGVISMGCQQTIKNTCDPLSTALMMKSVLKTVSSDVGMSVELCSAIAWAYFGTSNSNGNVYAALVGGTTCFIRNTAWPSLYPVADSQCSLACSGQPQEMCGGSCAFSLFLVNAQPSLPPTPKFAFLGAFWDCGGENGPDGRRRRLQRRALPVNPVYASKQMTVEMCVTMCAQLEQTLAGLQNSNQCFCGTDLNLAIAGGNHNIGTRPPVPCKGNPAEKCGASCVNDVYSIGLGTSAPTVRPVLPSTSQPSSTSRPSQATEAPFILTEAPIVIPEKVVYHETTDTGTSILGGFVGAMAATVCFALIYTIVPMCLRWRAGSRVFNITGDAWVPLAGVANVPVAIEVPMNTLKKMASYD